MEGAARGVVVHLRAQFHHSFQVGVHPAAADFVPARLGKPRMAEAGQQRPHHHHRTAKAGALGHKLLRVDVGGVHGIGLERVHAPGLTLDLDPHLLKQLDEVFHVQNLRDVGNGDGLGGEQNGTDDLQRLILCPLRGNASGQLVSAFDDEF